MTFRAAFKNQIGFVELLEGQSLDTLRTHIVLLDLAEVGIISDEDMHKSRFSFAAELLLNAAEFG